MKRVFQFGSILLAAYLLALPILMGIHAGQHSFHDTGDLHKSETTFQASECELCDLYENQVGLFELINIQALDIPDYTVQKVSPINLPATASAFISLRGPPLA